ncbi:MAG: uroporphyrinogen decarboxylase family protein [Candidatus Geothermincolia bacterium]
MPSLMSFEERLSTVLRGEVPDRVPFIPLLYYFAASYSGIPTREFLTDMRSYRKAMDSCFWEVGPWDAIYTLPFTMDAPNYDITWGGGLGMKPVLPTGETGAVQVLQAPESESLMEPEDYALIKTFDFPGKAYPLLRFMAELISRYTGMEPGAGLLLRRFIPGVARLGARWVLELERWRLRGVPYFISFSVEAPFDVFSMSRGLTGFALDLYRRPDEIGEASLELARSIAFLAHLACVATGVKRFLLLTHRSSNDFISPGVFEKLAFPSIKLIAEYLADRCISFGMHMDGNWGRNLEIMTDLPENTYFQFDGCTDIFRAREVLGDKYVIMGDVHPNMLALAGPSEVEEYCRRLIDEVGANGRFILSSGCEVPTNAKPENLRRIIETVKTYGRY